MKLNMDWVWNRLGESSTWRGFILLASGLGWVLSEEQGEKIAAAGLAIVGVINVLRKHPGSPDSPKFVPKDNGQTPTA